MSLARVALLGAGVLAVVGLLLGAIGAALFDRPLLVPVPQVHLAPQPVTTVGGFEITKTLMSAWLTTLEIVQL